jgi:hypothetical protein
MVDIFYQQFSFWAKDKEILTGRARRPAPTKITNNRQIFTVFVGATLRGCP